MEGDDNHLVCRFEGESLEQESTQLSMPKQQRQEHASDRRGRSWTTRCDMCEITIEERGGDNFSCVNVLFYF